MSEFTRVAAIIPAKDEAHLVAATVRACRAIPRVDLVLVVDDGSEDDTQHVARAAGAVVVRHSVNRGKASAMETGGSVVAMRDIQGREPRLLLFCDAALGESATSLAALIPPVVDSAVDLAIGVNLAEPTDRHKMVTSLARSSIFRLTGFAPTRPLAAQRLMTREAFDAATPLSRGWGVEPGMTIDVLLAGLKVQEVACKDLGTPQRQVDRKLRRAVQYRDVLFATKSRRMRGVRVPHGGKRAELHEVGVPYSISMM